MMRRTISMAAVAVAAVLPVSAAHAVTAAAGAGVFDRSIVPGRIVVRSVGRPGLLLGASARAVTPDTVTLSVPPAATSRVLAQLNLDPMVIYAEPDRWVKADAVPNDPYYGPQQSTYLNLIGAPRAWDITKGSAAVVVAVVDTRVDRTHVDLAGKVIDGGSVVDPVNENMNGCGGNAAAGLAHGTFVAGIIGATTNNGLGVAGLGWNTSVLAVRALNDYGCGTEAELAAGIRSATDKGAAIVNLSLSGPATSSVLSDAATYAQARGVILVAAAGNDSATTPRYPAALPGVLSVGATDNNDNVPVFSNRGVWVKMMAPGVGITSTVPGGNIQTGSGTSFASPLVAASAALIVAAHPGITPAGVFSRLERSAVAIPGTGTDSQFGRLDLGAALSLDRVGFRVATNLGEVGAYGDATYLGSMAGIPLARPVVGIASTVSGNGYWLVAGDGGIFSFGDGQFYGSTGAIKLNKPVVGLAATASGQGYWFVASDGGIFSYGDATFFGSTGALVLNKAVVGMARTPSGKGYWLVASDGGIFSYGDATFFGSTGALVLNKPIVGMAPTKSGHGYWLVASDGGIFAFGDAQFLGGTGGLSLGQPIAGMSVTASGNGYWLVSGDGTIYPEGDAQPLGSAAGVFAASLVSLAAI